MAAACRRRLHDPGRIMSADTDEARGFTPDELNDLAAQIARDKAAGYATGLAERLVAALAAAVARADRAEAERDQLLSAYHGVERVLDNTERHRGELRARAEGLAAQVAAVESEVQFVQLRGRDVVRVVDLRRALAAARPVTDDKAGDNA